MFVLGVMERFGYTYSQLMAEDAAFMSLLEIEAAAAEGGAE